MQTIFLRTYKLHPETECVHTNHKLGLHIMHGSDKNDFHRHLNKQAAALTEHILYSLH